MLDRKIIWLLLFLLSVFGSSPANAFFSDLNSPLKNIRTQVTDSNGAITYVTDPHGALSRVLSRTKNGQTTRYVYGVGLQYEVDASGNATYYHFDHVGNTAALTDESEAVIDEFRYSPYGTVTYQKNNYETPFQFGGFFGIQTDSNGLVHMRARFYNPLIRRFVNSDPARADWNWFAYAGGNPVNFVDPSGYNPLAIAAIILLGTTQTLNSPGPNDVTSNEAPLFEPMTMVAGGGLGGKTVSFGTKKLVDLSVKTTATKGVAKGANLGAKNTGFMSVEQITLSGASGSRVLAQAVSSNTLSTSQNIGANIITNYTRFAVTSGSAGLGLGLATDLQPDDANLSFNPFTTPFEIGNLAGGLISAGLSDSGSSFNSSSSSIK